MIEYDFVLERLGSITSMMKWKKIAYVIRCHAESGAKFLTKSEARGAYKTSYLSHPEDIFFLGSIMVPDKELETLEIL